MNGLTALSNQRIPNDGIFARGKSQSQAGRKSLQRRPAWAEEVGSGSNTISQGVEVNPMNKKSASAAINLPNQRTLADEILANGGALTPAARKVHEMSLQRRQAWARGEDYSIMPKGIERIGSYNVPSWVSNKLLCIIGKQLTGAHWFNDKCVNEAMSYTCSFFDDSNNLENNAEARQIFEQRFRDNLTGKNDISDYNPLANIIDMRA